MDYIKWLVLDKNRRFFSDGICVPVFFLNALVVGIITVAFWPLGVVLIAISSSFWGVVLFLFAKEAFDANYAEYLRKRNK